MQNIEVVNTICTILDDVQPRNDGNSYSQQITFVKDQPGHGWRYAIDASKIDKELDWVPEEALKLASEKR